jgi:DNA-binding transcriptional regulator YiaG
MPAKPKIKRAARPKRKPKYEWDSTKVKALREHLGLTQTEFAEELGTLQQTVSEWECGNHYPKGSSVKVLTLVAEKAEFKYGESKTAS